MELGRWMLPDQVLPELRRGSVWLVGAGPGDPGLLTIHATSALRQADVVLYDALVSEAVLALVQPPTLLENTGKRGHHANMPQSEITRRMIEHAENGLRVVRLKGGDPFVFGRGNEEAVALIERGIPVSVVPGITAGIASLTAASIAVTSRDANSAVTFATGHFAEGQSERIDWVALAKVGQPIVLYMAMRNLGAITGQLLEGGLPANTPLAIVCDATTDSQRVVETCLADAARDAAAAGVGAPAIVAIGENVRSRASLMDGLVQLRTSASPR